ncbi:hypothetical protein HEK616_40370 [Streptomyces nigrescens]|uniref:Uncharacterized protein n=1 Tax=Streptomyces nigrescens TaxID=1920 RepID=A0ABM7ZW07_STRNI|nr:hypothetical protein [Streptomyces nigrescens]BDM70550.1 hypothetical protein HEK616_40370 [Streptomyces nigrescens]
MTKVYERTENGFTTVITVREGLAEINHAQMAGKRDVRTMSSITRTDFAIEYKDGRSVRLVQVGGVCGNQWKYGKDVCALEVGHIGPHRNTKASEAWSFRWFNNEGTPAESDTTEEPEEWGTTAASVLAHKFHGEGPATTGADYRCINPPQPGCAVCASHDPRRQCGAPTACGGKCKRMKVSGHETCSIHI